MKEITRIITAQITIIEQVTYEEAVYIEQGKDIFTNNIKNDLKSQYGADDVTVTVQDFMLDK